MKGPCLRIEKSTPAWMLWLSSHECPPQPPAHACAGNTRAARPAANEKVCVHPECIPLPHCRATWRYLQPRDRVEASNWFQHRVGQQEYSGRLENQTSVDKRQHL